MLAPVGLIEFAFMRQNFCKLCVRRGVRMWFSYHDATLQVLSLAPARKINFQFCERSKRQQILWIARENFLQLLTRFLIIAKAAIRFCHSPRGFERTGVNGQRRVEGVKRGQEIGLGQCGSSTNDLNRGAGRMIVERVQKALGSLAIFLIDGGLSRGSERSVAGILRKIFRQRIVLLHQNGVAIFVF